MSIFEVFFSSMLPSRIFIVQTSCLYRHRISLLCAAALPVRECILQTVSDHPCETND